uniref:C-C motif chemokine n=1 Tax=Macaca nemestrina TaxID=9545 RepID=A0A2K6BQ83_MACNE
MLNIEYTWTSKRSLLGIQFCFVLFCFALVSFCHPSWMGSDPPTSCCFSYTARKLPRNFVVDYYETSSLCSQPAVVFQTKRGKQVCADPSETWVQEYVNDLELN